jgi:hypothetical protein
VYVAGRGLFRFAKSEMHVGFSGTREGMSKAQRETVKVLMGYWKILPAICHHGDCVGSDEEFQEICDQYGYFTVAHPPLNQKLRAFCNSSRIRAPKPYLERNHEIVDESHILIAAPYDFVEKGGTWATIRYARSEDLPTLLVRRDGSVLPS